MAVLNHGQPRYVVYVDGPLFGQRVPTASPWPKLGAPGTVVECAEEVVRYYVWAVDHRIGVVHQTSYHPDTWSIG